MRELSKRGALVLFGVVGIIAVMAILAFAPAERAELEAASLRYNYNVKLITGALDHYWKGNGRMAGSVGELLETGLIPANLVNPVTGEPLSTEGPADEPGEVSIRAADGQMVELVMCWVDGREIIRTIDSAMYTPEAISEENVLIGAHLHWATTALRSYYEEYGVAPGSIDDLAAAGYWPFTDEINPVSGGLLRFDSNDPGDLNFVFEEGVARVSACTAEGSYTLVGVPPEEFE